MAALGYWCSLIIGMVFLLGSKRRHAFRRLDLLNAFGGLLCVIASLSVLATYYRNPSTLHLALFEKLFFVAGLVALLMADVLQRRRAA